MKVIFEKSVFDAPVKGAVLALLNTAKTVKSEPKTFEEIRAALGKDDKELPDGTIHQIALDAGFEVVAE